MLAHGIELGSAEVAAFCSRWKIRRLSVFGSVLRDDFGPDSDVDLLAEFADDEEWDAFDEIHMQQELERILGRKVDLADRRAVETNCNRYRRKEILSSAELIYAPE